MRDSQHEAMHSSSPTDYCCADCAMDKEPCATCYTWWWKARHPEHIEVSTDWKQRAEAAAALESLQAENQALRSQVEELGGDPGHTLDSQIIDLRDENAALREKVAELERETSWGTRFPYATPPWK